MEQYPEAAGQVQGPIVQDVYRPLTPSVQLVVHACERTYMRIVVNEPERKSSIRLRDGRRFSWSEWGAKEGLPVLFCAGAATSGSLGFGVEHLDELGLRLVAFDRPGLGRSDPHPEKTLVSWSDDVREYLREAGASRALAVGFSQGAPFALALAGAGLVQAIGIVSGQDELAHPRIRRLLHPEVAGLVEAVEKDPRGFAEYFARIATSDALWNLIIDMSGTRDREVYAETNFSNLFQRALKEGFAQGPHGYVRDLVISLGPWPFAPEAIDVPVDLWYGRQDTSMVHSPDFGTTLASRFPNAVHVVDDNEGGSILWTRSKAILEQLRSRAANG